MKAAAATSRQPGTKPPRRKKAANGTAPGVSIRIRKPTHDVLTEIAQRRGYAIPELLERIVGEFARREKEVPDQVRSVIDRVDIISSPPHPRPLTDGDAPIGGIVK